MPDALPMKVDMCLICGCDRCLLFQSSCRDKIRLCLRFCTDSQDSGRKRNPLDAGPLIVNVDVLYDAFRYGGPLFLRLDIGSARACVVSSPRQPISVPLSLSARIS
jgi:hypothetical protein